MTDNDGQHNYSYDNLYQLIGADHPVQDDESFSYDSVGNRLTDFTGSYVFNNMNQLVEDSTYFYAYDENGNLIFKKDKETGNTHHYYFNAINQMTSYEKRDAGGELLVKAEYRYDAFGRRIYKAVDSNGDGVDDYVRKWVYDGANSLLEFDENNNLIAYYTSTGNIDEILSMNRNGNNYFYQKDGLNSVKTILDENGLIIQKYKFNAFGKLTDSLDSNCENARTYTGREFDGESNLYYYRSRYYDSNTGRFISSDSLRFFGGINFYIYAKNNSILFIDPYGLQAASAYKLGDTLNMFLGNKDAEDEATKWFPSDIFNEKDQDAFRHCIWSCKLSERYGENVSKAVTMTHEFTGMLSGQSLEDAYMDFNNNQKGLECSQKSRNEVDCTSKCLDAINNKELIIIK